MSAQILRIIDANCNRIGEGLRFIEDVARFTLDDASLSQQLRTMRHSIIKSINELGIRLISERNADTDVGANRRLINQQQDLPSLITANAKRAEEGLRVIEELSKLPEINQTLASNEFQKARFNLYTFEQKLLSRILRRQKITRLTGIYVILDTKILAGKDEIKAATQAISGGAKILQLRDKHHKKRRLITMAQELKDLCHKSDILFIINDHLDVALAVDADGLHIGQEDVPLTVARREMPIDKIIGCSATNLKQALKLETEGADYIAVGAVYPTSTKTNASIVGIEFLKQIKQKVTLPIVAIGGIDKDNIREVISAGADAVAVVSAVLQQDDIEKATRQMVSKIAQKRKCNAKPGKDR
jgi:thiamine-phosphate pyrophosphorylase